MNCTAGNGYTSGDTLLESGDQKMMKSFRGTQGESFTVTVTGLPTAYQASGYDVIVYFGGRADGATYTPEYVIGTEKRYLRDNTGTWDGVHRESTATSTAAAQAGDNYVRWRGLNAADFTLTVNKNGGPQRYGISGLQIIPTVSAPLTFAQMRAVVEPDPSDWVIVIPSVTGRRYELRESPSLSGDPASWALAAGPVSGDGSVLEFRLSKSVYPAAPRRFFIVVISPE